MCGRYALYGPWTHTAPAWEEHWASIMRAVTPPRYNIAPSQSVPVIVAGGEGPVLRGMRFGLVPHWARDPRIAYSSFNARAETLRQKPAYRDAWQRGQRCLVPASGWYEWRMQTGRRQPFFLHPRAAANPMMLAGLWSVWTGEGETPLQSFALITTAAQGEVREIHDRQPRVLMPEEWSAWLAVGVDDAAHWLTPELADLHWYPVDPRVGDVRQDDPGLIEPLPDATAPLPGTTLSLW